MQNGAEWNLNSSSIQGVFDENFTIIFSVIFLVQTIMHLQLPIDRDSARFREMLHNLCSLLIPLFLEISTVTTLETTRYSYSSSDVTALSCSSALFILWLMVHIWWIFILTGTGDYYAMHSIYSSKIIHYCTVIFFYFGRVCIFCTYSVSVSPGQFQTRRAWLKSVPCNAAEYMFSWYFSKYEHAMLCTTSTCTYVTPLWAWNILYNISY